MYSWWSILGISKIRQHFFYSDSLKDWVSVFFSFSVREFVVSVLFLKRRNAQQNLKWNSMPLNYCRCVCSTSVVLVGILNLIAKVYLRKHASPILNVMYWYCIVTNKVPLAVWFLAVWRMADWLVFSKLYGSKNLLWLPVPTNNAIALPQIYLKKK